MARRSKTPAPRGRAEHEFLSEAEEILERMRDDLAACLERASEGAELAPETLNRLFRSAHSLKGLSGMFGLEALAELAHRIEDLLDAWRLGRAQPTAARLGLFEQSVELFGRANVNHFLLEFDTPRAGSFEPLRFLPKTKGVVLGMVSSKLAPLESIDSLKRRADEAAKYVDPARCAISPQCGFASTMGGNPVTEADERAKLRLCVEAARAIWRS